MSFLTRFSLRKAPIVIMLVVLVILGGLYSATQLKSELLPNIDLPVVSVVAVYPGAAPDDVRRDVTEPIEKLIAGTSSLKTLTSVSNDSVAFITAEYEYGTDMEKAQQTIEDGVNRLTLPQQVQRPNVGRFNFQDIPVLAYTINTDQAGEDALAELRGEIESKLVPELKAINGVNSVTVAGGGNKQVVITLDDKKLSEKGISAQSITNLLQANNISFPTGEVVSGGQAVPVRVVNQFGSLADLRNMVVRPEVQATSGGGAPGGQAGGQPPAAQQAMPAVKLSEVATVELENDAADTISRSNGKPSLSLVVYKTQNANTVQVADAINARINDLKTALPGSEAVVLFDQSTFIKESLDGLIREGVLGAILAIAVILIFLTSIRSTLITAVSIPLSVMIALVLMNVLGVSLNIMSLAGLAVAIGRVVDDSIVVLENIYRHHFQNGESLRDAAFNGTKEVASAITSSTITTVCVFLPLGFIAGLVSEFFRPFALAVTVSLLASLLVALTVIPVLAVLLLKTGRAKDPGKAQHVERDTWVQRLYTPAITLALSKRWTKLATLGLALLLFVGSMALSGAIGTTFINFGSDKVLSATVRMKPGTDIETTSRAAAALEEEIQKHETVKNYQTTIGSNTDAASSGFVSLGSNSTADMTVTLDREANIRAEADWLRGLIAGQAEKFGVESYSVTQGTGGGPNSSSFSVVVSGSDYEDVLKTSDALVGKLKNVKDLVNVTSDAARAKPEIRVKVDPAKALAHGSTTIQIAGQVRNLLTSQKVTEITLDGKTYEVQATYDPATLGNIEAIKAIKVGTVNPVALSEVADVALTDGPVSITRVNQERSITVRGTINADSTSGVTADAQEAINELTPGAGTKVTIAGVAQQQAESFQQLGVALVVAIVLVYMVMVLTFGSLSTPFIIMFSLPLAAIGSIVALFVTNRPLGISALIGVLMLVGIVVTNAIVLLDLVEQYKAKGMSTQEALIQGGRTRVRPIVMTAIATMIALMPLVLGFSEGSIIAAELGTVVVGGLFTSTFLTLIVVPVVYSLLDSVKERLGGRGRKAEEDADEHRNGVEHDLDSLDKAVPAAPVGA
jgi:HAE1 family hydrophobic/amphiphilic exporter-1